MGSGVNRQPVIAPNPAAETRALPSHLTGLLLRRWAIAGGWAQTRRKGTLPASPCHLQIHHTVQSQQLYPERVTPQGQQLRCPHRGPTHSPAGTPTPHSDGLFARKTGNAPVAGLYSNDFFSCIFQKHPPAPVSGSESGRSSGSGTCVASGQSTCSPWISGSSAPWSLCRGRPGGPAVVGSHSGSVSGSVTWIHQMWNHCHFSCEGDHQAGDNPS